MLEFVYFVFEQFFSLFLWLDTIYIIDSLSLLRIIIISFILIVVFHLLGGKEHD